MQSLSVSNSFPSPLAPRTSRDEWEGYEPSNSCSTPRIIIERPSSPASLSSRLSSEPLDPALWDQHNLFLSLEASTLDTSPTQLSSDYSSCALSLHSQSSLSSPSSRSTSPVLNEDPPDYTTTVQRPAESVQYDFSSTSYNSMIVASSSDDQNFCPKYHVAITMNCFMPLSHITTIRRGGSAYGQFVAQFEMGIAHTPSTVTIDGTQVLIASVLSKRTGKRLAGLWFWTPPDKVKGVLWDCRTVPFVCRSVPNIGAGSEESLLANFTPAEYDRGGKPSIAKLTVKPKGQNVFDHLLLSLLIIERKRLTPGKDKVLKQLFN